MVFAVWMGGDPENVPQIPGGEFKCGWTNGRPLGVAPRGGGEYLMDAQMSLKVVPA